MSIKRWLLFIVLVMLALLCSAGMGYRLVKPLAAEPTQYYAYVAVLFTVLATLSVLSEKAMLNFMVLAGLIVSAMLVMLTTVVEMRYHTTNPMLLMATMMVPVVIMCLVVSQREHLVNKIKG